ncbi:hypothetical protein Belba_0687 [Belliella baltica DSM 15883]|uniref:Uncharacterized protein n=1 Tax=Belliella baltica (strain DSM 15883 / CIP 108006 / LMG 21964 / BA134) TaxID=866536 RepID=I3Z274_BELBD|nr:hypothetical protein [Belliella baltica]AFL83342.1 hypothetical protein Belba_0687 [Belliella baltica DSM 15883]
MKDPEHNSWKNRLPEHLPDEIVWGKILGEKFLDQQVSSLKNQLPIHTPKENLWFGIQKGIERKKRIIVFYRFSAAAVFLFGIWGMIWLAKQKSVFEEEFLMTDITNTITIQPTLIQAPPQDVMEINSTSPSKKELTTSPELIPTIKKEEIVKEIEVAIPLPEIFVAEIYTDEIENELDTAKDIKGSKKVIAVNWEEPNRRIKIDGFNVELSDKELKAIKDLNNRKKGRLRLQINALTARLYEQ